MEFSESAPYTVLLDAAGLSPVKIAARIKYCVSGTGNGAHWQANRSIVQSLKIGLGLLEIVANHSMQGGGCFAY
jgi:hypothetical protein